MTSPAQQVDEAEPEQQWPVVIALKHPIAFGSEHITSLAFRRGVMKDMKGLTVESVPPVDKLLLIASRLCGKPVAALEMVDADDAPEVLALALGFFNRCLGVGKMPSEP